MKNKQIIRDFLGQYINCNDLSDQDNIFENGLVNSLFAMQMVMFVEKQFGIKVENQDLNLKNFSSINALSSFIENYNKQ